MIGTKIYKQDLNLTEYENTSSWCNKNNAMLIDKEEYFEVVPCPDFTKEQKPSLDERIAVIEDAINNLMEGVATNG